MKKMGCMFLMLEDNKPRGELVLPEDPFCIFSR